MLGVGDRFLPGDLGDRRLELDCETALPAGLGGIRANPRRFDLEAKRFAGAGRGTRVILGGTMDGGQQVRGRAVAAEQHPQPGVAAHGRQAGGLPGDHSSEVEFAVREFPLAEGLDQPQAGIERVAAFFERGAFPGSDLPRRRGPAGDPERHVEHAPACVLQDGKARAVFGRMHVEAVSRLRHPGRGRHPGRDPDQHPGQDPGQHPRKDRKGAARAASLPVDAGNERRPAAVPLQERRGHRRRRETSLVIRGPEPVDASVPPGCLAGRRGPAVRDGLGIHVREQREARGFRRDGDQVDGSFGRRRGRAELRMRALRCGGVLGDLDREAVQLQILPEAALRLPGGASVRTRRRDQRLEEREQFAARALGERQRAIGVHSRSSDSARARGTR